MFVPGPQRVGSPDSEETPRLDGPRHCGQSSAASPGVKGKRHRTTEAATAAMRVRFTACGSRPFPDDSGFQHGVPARPRKNRGGGTTLSPCTTAVSVAISHILNSIPFVSGAGRIAPVGEEFTRNLPLRKGFECFPEGGEAPNPFGAMNIGTAKTAKTAKKRKTGRGVPANPGPIGGLKNKLDADGRGSGRMGPCGSSRAHPACLSRQIPRSLLEQEIRVLSAFIRVTLPFPCVSGGPQSHRAIRPGPRLCRDPAFTLFLGKNAL